MGQLLGFTQLGLDILQIDDGWQEGVGDQHANEKFGKNLGTCASDITALGVTLDVWVTPFIVRPGTLFPIEHPKAFVHAPSEELAIAGYNWGGPYYTSDMTHPLAQEYLYDLAQLLVDASIGYVKADFVSATAVGDVRYEVDVTRDDAYVIDSRLLREVLGDDTHLLGSDALIISSIGIYDGIHAGCDVTPVWKNYATEDRSGAEVRNAFTTFVARL